MSDGKLSVFVVIVIVFGHEWRLLAEELICMEIVVDCE